MKKRFIIQHIWFNNQDADVTIVGLMQEDVLAYESKLVIKMSRLNSVISAWQRQTNQEASDYMCRFELGFVTEYEICFPSSVQCALDLSEFLDQGQSWLKQIVA